MKTCMTSQSQPKIFTEDLLVRDALPRHDAIVTREFFYKQCYPLFKSIFDNYYTDCITCKEFIDEIYLLVLAPGKKSGKCQLENYRGESTLLTWLKTACLFYCYNKYEMKERLPKYEPIVTNDGEEDDVDDRIDKLSPSIEIDFSNLNSDDVNIILSMMPNRRYSNLVRLRFWEQKTDSETAEALGMTMSNYYNKKILAVKQYNAILRKEDKYGK